MRSKKEIQLLGALEAAACSHGFDLVELEQTGSGRSTLLRIYLDKPDGLTLDDVASANSWVAEVVEALDPYKGSYTLEVSSPGIDRPVRTLGHFEKAVGEEAVITLESAGVFQDASDKDEKPRLKYTGKILTVNTEEQIITLEAEGARYPLRFADIKKARIKGRFDFEGQKG